jgi:site-specific recombinase XerD
MEKEFIQALNPQEVEALLRQCSGKKHLDVRNHAIIMVLLDTGMRLGKGLR